MDKDFVLEYALDIGEQMVICGAEISRVEDTIERICRAYGAERIDVFSITSCIIATLKMEGEPPVTQTRRIRSSNTDFTKMDKLNALSRRICENKPDQAELRREFKRIELSEPLGKLGQYASFALVSASSSVFFGGSWGDAFVACIVGLILRWLTTVCKRFHINGILSDFLCAFGGGLVAMLALRLGLGNSFDKIAIGDIMPLIPGILLTNSLRDMISGDTVSGLLRLCNALLGSVAIAMGFALAGGMLG